MEENLGTFDAFCRIIAKLRSPDGCPWDRKQTHESLKPYLIEEAYETLQTLDDGDTEKLCEELGDLLLQIGLHAQIAEESGEFEMSDILRHINEKLIRRHPHVFGDVEVADENEVRLNWEEIKRSEGKVEKSLLDGIPKGIPALAYSQIMQQRASRIGFDWNNIDGVLDKVSEELEEIRQAETHQERVHEFGDLVMALANAARWMEIDLESALRQANERFYERFAYMEETSENRGICMNGLPIDDLDALWEEAKKNLEKGG
ncbi:MAG: nucleoside triphosphate pyrophosphohydrolase [Chloroflexi bacterium]|jgi:tetrapyrrole methylase family protein / MazG family protein|nr:nucleoside triphosphate pyrophosphohydrolase [Chloroflexota bacterium]